MFFLIFLLLLYNIPSLVLNSNGAMELTSHNFHSIVANYRLVLVNFRVKWCPYSKNLDPIFDQAADVIHQENISVLLAKVDCQESLDLSNSFRVTKFPTVLLLKDGHFSGREYSSERTVSSIVKFVKDLYYIGPKNITEDQLIGEKGPSVVLKIDSSENNFYKLFFKLGYEYNIDCKFYSIFGYPSGSKPELLFISQAYGNQAHNGDLDSGTLSIWINSVCRPLVREIEFSNAEEITATSNALLIMFYDPLRKDFKDHFKDIVKKHENLLNGVLRPVTANANVFQHALHHLGKSVSDAPLVVIDNFRHMFLFPNYNNLEIDSEFIQFLEDFKSDKLHREFHEKENPNIIYINFENRVTKKIVKVEQDTPEPNKDSHQPKKMSVGKTNGGSSIFRSIFNRLAPNDRRYTLLNHDDL